MLASRSKTVRLVSSFMKNDKINLFICPIGILEDIHWYSRCDDARGNCRCQNVLAVGKSRLRAVSTTVSTAGCLNFPSTEMVQKCTGDDNIATLWLESYIGLFDQMQPNYLYVYVVPTALY
jgi:hypothetical protein